MDIKSILFITNSLGIGGAEKQVVSLFNNIDRKKFKTVLGYLDDNHELLPQIDEELRLQTICFHRKKRFDLNVLMKMKEVASNNNVNIVICVNQYTMLYAFLLKKLFNFNFQIIVVIHTTILRSTYSKIKNILYRRIMNRCDRVLFVCANQMKYWNDKYGINEQKSRFIYNGVDVELFSDRYDDEEKKQLKEKLKIGENEVVLGICAVLRPEKKHEDLILAVRKLINEGRQIKVLVIGDGPRRSFIENFINKHEMNENVVITGFKKDVRPYLAISDFMITASHSIETFSIAILEAMAMSKGIVATDIGGASEMIKDGVNGYLYRPGDIGELSLKIRNIIDNNLSHSMGIRSCRIVKEKFEISKMVSSYESLFSS